MAHPAYLARYIAKECVEIVNGMSPEDRREVVLDRKMCDWGLAVCLAQEVIHGTNSAVRDMEKFRSWLQEFVRTRPKPEHPARKAANTYIFTNRGRT